jgi:hypothetical protein
MNADEKKRPPRRAPLFLDVVNRFFFRTGLGEANRRLSSREKRRSLVAVPNVAFGRRTFSPKFAFDKIGVDVLIIPPKSERIKPYRSIFRQYFKKKSQFGAFASFVNR